MVESFEQWLIRTGNSPSPSAIQEYEEFVKSGVPEVSIVNPEDGVLTETTKVDNDPNNYDLDNAEFASLVGDFVDEGMTDQKAIEKAKKFLSDKGSPSQAIVTLESEQDKTLAGLGLVAGAVASLAVPSVLLGAKNYIASHSNEAKEILLGKAGVDVGLTYASGSQLARSGGLYGYGTLARYGLLGAALGSFLAGVNWDLGRNLIDALMGEEKGALTEWQKYQIWKDAQEEARRSPEGFTQWQQYQMFQDERQYQLQLARMDGREYYNPAFGSQEEQAFYRNDGVEHLKGLDEKVEYDGVEPIFDDFEVDELDFYDGFLSDDLPLLNRTEQNLSFNGYLPLDLGEPESEEFIQNSGENRNMSFRYRNNFRRNGSNVSVGRYYVFSMTPRRGFYRKWTKAGVRYVKRRRY